MVEEQIAPFSRPFPGLAPASQDRLDPSQLDDVLSSLPPARIGLLDRVVRVAQRAKHPAGDRSQAAAAGLEDCDQVTYSGIGHMSP
jgi:hypothetical protein